MRIIGYINGPQGVIGHIMDDRSVVSDTIPSERIGHVEGMNLFDRHGTLIGHLDATGEEAYSAADGIAAALLK